MARQFPIEGKTEFTAKIPTPLYNEFVGFLPIHGANTWFITQALNNLLAELRKDPTLSDRIRDAIQTTVKEV